MAAWLCTLAALLVAILGLFGVTILGADPTLLALALYLAGVVISGMPAIRR